MTDIDKLIEELDENAKNFRTRARQKAEEGDYVSNQVFHGMAEGVLIAIKALKARKEKE